MRSTSACSSTSSGRRPSRVTVTTLPGAGSPERARKIADGLRTSRRPCSLMWKNASSPTEPKRFLVARTLRKRLEASLSKYSTVSTRCSSTRGPAMAPSLVTWPTMMTLTSVGLREAHQLRGAFAQLGDRAGGRAHRRQLHGLNGIDDQQPDAFLAGARHRRLEIGVRDHAQVRRAARRGGARARRSAPRIPRPTDTGSGCDARDVVRQLQQQRRFADAGFAT